MQPCQHRGIAKNARQINIASRWEFPYLDTVKSKPGASRKRTAGGAIKRKPAKTSIKNLSPKQLQKRLTRQRQQEKVFQQKKRALAAVKSFRVKKADRGKFVLLTPKGKRGASLKGRKGYLVYVSKAGKKSLQRVSKDFKPKKATDISAPLWRNLKASQEFEHAKLEKTAGGKAIVKGRGSIAVSGVNDFSDKVVAKMAASLKRTIEGQASHRSFLISANVWIVLPDGTDRVYSFVVPIAKADHIAIKIGGLLNFVRHKFYAFMARELAFDGYVTSGSANHVRRLKENKGLEVGDFTTRDGNMWRGNESDIVRIKLIEWQIEQAK